MLVLARKKHETIRIGPDIFVKVIHIHEDRAWLAIDTRAGNRTVEARIGKVIGIAPDIAMMVVSIRERQVRLGTDAPKDIAIHRIDREGNVEGKPKKEGAITR